MLTVNEIFHSIQGESTFSGRPCVFVRLTACDLRCTWCDTPYAFDEGGKRPVDEVAREVAGFGCDLVEVTGGEPLLQDDVYPLMEALLAQGRTVLLETGGHRSTERVPQGVVTILDVKCPASGESHRNHWENLGRLRPHDELYDMLGNVSEWCHDWFSANYIGAPTLDPAGPGFSPPVPLAGPMHVSRGKNFSDVWDWSNIINRPQHRGTPTCGFRVVVALKSTTGTAPGAVVS